MCENIRDVPVLSTGAGTEVPGRYFEVPAPVLAQANFRLMAHYLPPKFITREASDRRSGAERVCGHGRCSQLALSVRACVRPYGAGFRQRLGAFS